MNYRYPKHNLTNSHIVFLKDLEEKLESEITQVDQKLVLELDQLVSDQQATLQVSYLCKKRKKNKM